jgi:hypothetical protein
VTAWKAGVFASPAVQEKLDVTEGLEPSAEA